MNKTEMNTIELAAENSKPTAGEAGPQEVTAARSQHTLKSKREGGTRYAALAVIVLLLGALGLYVRYSIAEIDAQIQQTQENFGVSGDLGID